MATGNPTCDPSDGNSGQSPRSKYRTGVGLLWLDRENVGIQNTLPQAIARFKAKFKRPPTLIYLLIGAIAQEYNLDDKLRVVPTRNCPHRHAMLF